MSSRAFRSIFVLAVLAIAGCGSSALPVDSSFTLETTVSVPADALVGTAVRARTTDETEVYLSVGLTVPGTYEVTVTPDGAEGWAWSLQNPAPGPDGRSVITVTDAQIASASGGTVQAAIQFLLTPSTTSVSPLSLHLQVSRDGLRTGREITLDVTAR